MITDKHSLAVSDEQIHSARQQLGLPNNFELVEAARLLSIETCSGLVQIPLPGKQVVVVFESDNGLRRYGVVIIEDIWQGGSR